MATKRPVPEVSADDAAGLVRDGAVLLDVREADEWEAGHAPGAVWVPMREVLDRREELPADRRIVAVCRVGGRSAAVTEALTAAGFDIVNLAGGLRAWAAAGHPVVTDAGARGTVV